MKTYFGGSLRPGCLIAAAGLLMAVKLAAADGMADARALASYAREATSDDTAQAEQAVGALRSAGADGLTALSEVYSNEIAEHLGPAPREGAKDKDWERLRAVFDTVGQQRDCWISQLYWFTDLEKAKAAARAAGKPILSLRLLGRLNEEYSCANSRFFRTTLYPNAEVSRFLRENFVLHWQSVRPVPRITIDMGDGRKIERTITGNSIHYVLDADGNPIDALPGLYGAKAFIDGLKRALAAERQAARLGGIEREKFLRDYHAAALAEIQRRWSNDLAQIDNGPGETRFDAMRDDAKWAAIARLHYGEAVLDADSLKLIAAKGSPSIEEAMPLALSKSVVESPMMRMVGNLQTSIAEDTVRNEYQLHASIHKWFADGNAPASLDELNAKIYAELFLTPETHPGLAMPPAGRVSRLDNR